MNFLLVNSQSYNKYEFVFDLVHSHHHFVFIVKNVNNKNINCRGPSYILCPLECLVTNIMNNMSVIISDYIKDIPLF